ncbi:MAG TPA: metallophosphoesterase [Tepidisphaeraceae bacterium]|jgi:3',5'-cyclic AMP phosphodiesterase CpdA|nr:metallophosphoesterase [Tepidisphaeraceae bacterium]
MRTIAHISDLHFGRLDEPVAEALVDELHAANPSLVICSGDFTQRARVGQFEAAAEYMKRLPRPQLVVPGNHDIPLWDLLFLRRIVSPLGRYRRYIAKDVRPVYRDDELLVIGINTARQFTWSWKGFWKDGGISEEQLVDVRVAAKDAPDDQFKIVVTHHPFIPPPGDERKGIVHRSRQALATMERAGVDLLLAGHLHRGYSADVRGHHEAVKRAIISVQAGTATSTRRRDEPNAYNRIKVDKDYLSIDVRAWNGSAFITSAVREFRKLAGAWTLQDAAEVAVPPVPANKDGDTGSQPKDAVVTEAQ